MNAPSFFSQLRGVKKNASGWTAFCPAHDDANHESLSIKVDGERILLHCFAGCQNEAIVRALGVSMRDLFAKPNGAARTARAIVSTHDYRDVSGTLLYQVVRRAPKEFRARRPDGNGGWTYALGDTRRVVYRMRELAGERQVLWVEGEKDADRLAAVGFSVTTSPFGAKSWRDEYAQQVAGLLVEEVCILPDNDEPGLQYAANVLRSCLAAGLSARIIDLPGLGPKEDVSDWLDAGHTVEELGALLRARSTPPNAEPAAPAEPVILVRSIHDSLARAPESLAVRYTLRPYIPERSLGGLSGGPGVGKGKFVQSFLLARASGQSFLGLPVAPGPSLLWSGEQGRDEDDRVFQAFARGMKLAPADIRHPLFVLSDPPARIDHPAMLEQVLSLARAHPGLFVVLDSLRRAFPGDEVDSESPDRFFRDIFVPLRALGASVLFLAHPPKPPAQGELRLDSLLRGSGDWLAILDSFMVLKAAGRQRIDPRTEDIHASLLHVKARRGPRAEEGTVTLHVTADETPDLAFAFSFARGGTEVTRAQLAIEALAAFYRECGRAGRKEYLAHFEGRFSERQLDPARKMLVAQGVLKEIAGGPGKSSIWAWTGVDGSVDGSPAFEQETFDAVL